MIALEDRCSLAQDIQDARDGGARLKQVCDVAGIDERTLQRWNAQEGLKIPPRSPFRNFQLSLSRMLVFCCENKVLEIKQITTVRIKFLFMI